MTSSEHEAWASTSRSIIAGAIFASGCGLSVVGAATPDSGITTDAGGPDSSGAGLSDATDDRSEPTPIHAQSALHFVAASSQYVDFANIALPADFTVEAWIKPSSSGSEMMVAAEDRTLNTADQFRLAILATGHLYFAMSDRFSNYYGLMDYSKPVLDQFALRSPSPVPVGTWSHVAVTKDGADFALLVDGSVVAAFTAGSGAFPRDMDWNFRIAARMGNGGPDGYFDGIIDDLRIYTRARTPSVITADMSRGAAPGTQSFADLASYWRFDEGAGAELRDDVAGHVGTLKNEPRWVPSDAF